MRIAHLAENENDKFMTEQKSTNKRPWSVSASTSTHCIRTSRFEGLGNFVLNLLLRPSLLVQLVAINTLARNAGGAVTNISIVERSITELPTVRNQKEGMRRRRLLIKEGCLPLQIRKLRRPQQ